MEDIINKKENNLKNKSWPREEISTTIKMSTIPIRQWKGIHPVSKNLVVGNIIILTENNTIEFEKPNSNAKSSKSSKKSSGSTGKSDFLESSDLEGEDF